MLSLRRLVAQSRAGHRWLRLLVAVGLTIPTTLSVPTPAHALEMLVNSTLDEHDATLGDGACRSTPSNVCTLRAAIEESNTFASGDTIRIPAGIYTLSLGELRVTGSAFIEGAGQDLTIVQAATQRGVAFSRVFHLQPSGNDQVNVSRLTMRHGRVREPDLAFGGGALVSGLVNLRQVSILNNMADASGGGISNSGRLNVRDSLIAGNEAGRSGGGITCTVGEGASQDGLVISNTLIASNFAGTRADFGGGGGLAANDCNVSVDRSTFTDNQAPAQAGGVWLDEKGTHVFTNVTISRNTSQGQSGGVHFTGQEASGGSPQSTLLLSHATIANNRTTSTGVRTGANLVSAHQERVSVRNSIIVSPAGTTQNCNSGKISLPPIAQVTSLGGNIQFPGSTCFSTSPPTGTADFNNVDPQLLPLANNGGLTPTHALASTSRAIDHPRASTCLSVDQRGLPRPRDGNGDGIARCDSGAFEVQSGSTGAFSLNPTAATAQVGDRLTYEFTWTVPAPGNWHNLSGLDLRLRDAGGIAFWVHWDEAANTFSLVDPATGAVVGPAFATGSTNQLVGEVATLLLAESSVQGSGPTGPSVTLKLRLALAAAAAGRTFTVEVLGADDQGTVQGFEAAGTLRVAGVSLNDPNNQDEDERDEKPKETEEQRQQRRHTNAGHRGDMTTEGNVSAVERPEGADYLLITIALTRNETLVVQVFCEGGRCPDIQVGDYLEADGYQNGVGDPNTWFVASDGVEITRNGKRVK